MFRLTTQIICAGAMMMLVTPSSIAQTGGDNTSEVVLPQSWTYGECVSYAKTHNIKLQQSMLTKESGTYDLEAAKAQWFPTLDFATTQAFTNYPSPADGTKSNSYNGSYGLNAGWTIYNGGKRNNNIKKEELQEKVNDLSIEEIHNNLETEILVDYLQILYAREAIDIAQKSLEVSKLQMERAEQLMKAGKVSRVDYTQLESQYHSDKYNVISAESNLASKKMTLKQLLELGIAYDINLTDLSFTEEQVLQALPSKEDVYATAVTWLPGLKSTLLQGDMNDLSVKIAKAGYLPTITLNGSVGTGNGSGTGYGLGDQLRHRLNEQIGVTLSIPILDGKTNKTNVAKATINRINTDLEYKSLQNDVAQSIESSYIEAQSAQAKYVSGKEQLKSAELTDELTNEQFKLGLVNTLDLLTSHNKLLTARQELLQSKYLAILNIKMLDFYQNKTITLQ